MNFLRTPVGIAATLATVLMVGAGSAHAGFVSYVIRGTPTIDTSVSGQTEFVISASGQKAGLGSSDVDGSTLGSISDLRITRLDDITRFTAGSGPAVGPYLNFWITDGLGNYAVVANEPSNPEWNLLADGSYDLDFSDLADKTAKIFEAPTGSSLAALNSPSLKFSDLANYIIEAPSPTLLATGWTGLGTGAPRELGTNLAYGVNWVFGDTLSNYVSGDDGYIVAGAAVSAVPEPASLALAGLALGGLAFMRRRRTR